eukprot:jgi/Mesvir1/18340/Mv14241-RA.1
MGRACPRHQACSIAIAVVVFIASLTVDFSKAQVISDTPTFTALIITAPRRRQQAAQFLEDAGFPLPLSESLFVPAIMAKDNATGTADCSGFVKKYHCDLTGKMKDGKMVTIGEAGVFLSHMKCVGTYLNTSPADYLIVFEDDVAGDITVQSISDTIQYMHNCRGSIGDWHIVNLGRCWADCRTDKSLGVFTARANGDKRYTLVESERARCAQAIVYTRQGAQRVYSRFLSHGPVVGGACYNWDTWLTFPAVSRMLSVTPFMSYQRGDLVSERTGDLKPEWLREAWHECAPTKTLHAPFPDYPPDICVANTAAS